MEIFAILRQIKADFPDIESVLLKTRHSKDEAARKGIFLHGDKLPSSVTENGVNYALNLQLNQDDSFYLDTRMLRQWLKANSKGKKVLNFFAYTGSLGIAALAGGANLAIQTDINGDFLSIAKQSQNLNDFTGEMKVWKSDYFKAVAHLKQAKSLFDQVVLDAPYYAENRHGEIDLQMQFINLVNKARPLVGHDGRLIVINNALFVPGSQVIGQINQMSLSGYLSLEETIDIPQDVTGYPETILNKPPTDPAPFKHPTKIAILHITRKDRLAAGN
jgi:23S rRNA (cytosine1962-C5)-methyltransferase